MGVLLWGSLTRSLPDCAKKWREKLETEQQNHNFTLTQVTSLPDDWVKLQIQTHGLLSYLLVARDDPVLVLASGADIEDALRKDAKLLPWLRADAFLLIVTDQYGMELACKNHFTAYPWDDSLGQSQPAILSRAAVAHRTSALRGFTEPSLALRKRIIACAGTKDQNDIHGPVLILGETGSGKEVVANALYQASRRPAGCYGKVGCAMLTSQLLIDQLFGHWPGAYTGAGAATPGDLEKYEHGAVLVDDLDSGEQPLLVQGALLRFMSTSPHQVKRLGHPPSGQPETHEVKTWLLVSTNQNPREMVDNGTMREDFLFRFRHIIRVPPLRERPGDIPFVARSFWRELAGAPELDIPALMWLRDRKSDWKGNAREVQALLLRAFEFKTEDAGLTWSKAFEKVVKLGDHYLDWLSGVSAPAKLRLPCGSDDLETFLPQLLGELDATKPETWLHLADDRVSDEGYRDRILRILRGNLTDAASEAVTSWDQKQSTTGKETGFRPILSYWVLLYLVLHPDHQCARQDMARILGRTHPSIHSAIEQNLQTLRVGEANLITVARQDKRQTCTLERHCLVPAPVAH